ncbi:MAG: nucleoside deaminase [Wenzhouxiangella sp.]
MTFSDTLRIDLPSWVRSFHGSLPSRLATAEHRMEVAISLARQNVIHQSGGPFGALVVERDSGQVIAFGVNRVEPTHCSSAHAEIMALSLAQQRLAHWNLGQAGRGEMELVTSCEPCAMCLGAIPWSGIQSLVCGAVKADAEAVGFDEGDRPDDWADKLIGRGIRVVTGVLRRQAAEVLERYGKAGSTIYGPELPNSPSSGKRP